MRSNLIQTSTSEIVRGICEYHRMQGKHLQDARYSPSVHPLLDSKTCSCRSTGIASRKNPMGLSKSSDQKGQCPSRDISIESFCIAYDCNCECAEDLPYRFRIFADVARAMPVDVDFELIRWNPSALALRLLWKQRNSAVARGTIPIESGNRYGDPILSDQCEIGRLERGRPCLQYARCY